jgi:ABC-2 type transport system ATP-binding protein
VEAIRLENVSKEFSLHESHTAKDWILGIAGRRPRRTRMRAVDDVSFSVQAGESVALLGHNGSGKSTTLKMIAGVIRPSQGLIRLRGRVAPLLELGSGFHPDLTGRENIFLNGSVLGIPRAEIARKFDEIVDFSGIHEYLDTPVKFYSSGMVVRLGFSVAVNVRPDVLLIDEVLAVGDEAFQVQSRQRMEQFKAQGITIVLVTHSHDVARSFCGRQLVLEKGRLVADGPFPTDDPTDE